MNLGQGKWVQVKRFNFRTYVHFTHDFTRDDYDPKGIVLTIEQYQRLKGFVPKMNRGQMNLGRMKYVHAKQFKGRIYVDIRQYFYIDDQYYYDFVDSFSEYDPEYDDYMHPTKKGIILNLEQYKRLEDFMPKIAWWLEMINYYPFV